MVILEGRATSVALDDPEADVSVSVSFPGEVTSTNGDQVATDVVEWKLRPGVVSTMSAQARYTDPSARSFTGAAIWLGVGSFLVAGMIAALAYANRDRSPASARKPNSWAKAHAGTVIPRFVNTSLVAFAKFSVQKCRHGAPSAISRELISVASSMPILRTSSRFSSGPSPAAARQASEQIRGMPRRTARPGVARCAAR